MEKYYYNIIHANKCCKCGSHNINKRFLNYEDTEDYHFHHDTLKCLDCGYWDFPSAFSYSYLESNNTEVCPKCRSIGKTKLYSYDFFSGIELECACGYIDNIEKFVGVDRWNELIEEEKQEMERNRKIYVDAMEEEG